MKPPIRLAILECDTPPPDANAKYHGYGGVFTVLLHAGADALGNPDVLSSKHGLDISVYDVVKQQYPNLEDIDAVLLTGSKFNSFDNDEWILKLVSFTEQLLKQDRVRIVGVCFGHQILGRAFGAKVARSDVGWETSVCPVKLTERGQELFGREGMMSIHQMHRDIVYEWPDGVERLGSSPRCEVQGMYLKNRLISVQGHPEFNEEIMKELLEARKEQGIFDEDFYREAMERCANHHDGVAVASAFIKFLLDD